MVKRMKSLYLGIVPVLVALLLLFSGFPVSQASAADTDIILGIFYDNDTNYKNTLYVSDNGSDFKKLKELNLYQQDGNTLGGMSCPSIMYKDGYFWRLSG